MKKTIYSAIAAIFFLSACAQPTVTLEPELTMPKDAKATMHFDGYGLSVEIPPFQDFTSEDIGSDKIIFNDKTIAINHLVIGQPYPKIRIHIETTSDPAILDYLQQDGPFSEKTINGLTFKEFHRSGEGTGYGYVIQRDNLFYVFESVIGPQNDVFEKMMQSLKFD